MAMTPTVTVWLGYLPLAFLGFLNVIASSSFASEIQIVE